MVESDLLAGAEEAKEDLTRSVARCRRQRRVFQVKGSRKITFVDKCAIVTLVVHVEGPEEPTKYYVVNILYEMIVWQKYGIFFLILNKLGEQLTEKRTWFILVLHVVGLQIFLSR